MRGERRRGREEQEGDVGLGEHFVQARSVHPPYPAFSSIVFLFLSYLQINILKTELPAIHLNLKCRVHVSEITCNWFPLVAASPAQRAREIIARAQRYSACWRELLKLATGRNCR